MLISYNHRFIFFHVAKAAGLSMKEAIKEYAQEPEKFKIKRPPKKLANNEPNPFYARWESMMMHVKAREAQKELPPEVYNDFYKFAFVRNPWDWQVSMYHFLLKEPDNPKYELVKSMSGFEEYLEWVIQTDNPYPMGATKLQMDMIADAQGQILIDFVGRYETLVEDFQTVCQTVNMNASLPHLNRSSHRDYQSYYNERTKQLVAEHFQADIEALGYHFDGYHSKLGMITH